MNYNEKRFLMRAVFVALLGTMFGCGEVTPLAPDGGGGAAGRETLSTGGVGGHLDVGGAAGHALGGQAGADPPAGGAAGAPTGSGGSVGGAAGQTVVADGGAGQGGGAGAVTVTADGGSPDVSACPRTLRTAGPLFGWTPPGVVSGGLKEGNFGVTGGGPDGGAPLAIMHVDMVPSADQNNPVAGSYATISVAFEVDCNGNFETDTDMNLQGYRLSFWVYEPGVTAPCTQIGWRVGVVNKAGTISFPWGADMGVSQPGIACTGSGVFVDWTGFPVNTKGYELVIQFYNSSAQEYSGLIDVGDPELTFSP